MEYAAAIAHQEKTGVKSHPFGSVWRISSASNRCPSFVCKLATEGSGYTLIGIHTELFGFKSEMSLCSCVEYLVLY